MVPNMLPAMRRIWDCEMREVGVMFSSRVDIRIVDCRVELLCRNGARAIVMCFGQKG